MAAASSSLFLLFLNLPHLLQHHRRPHCPALCLHSKNPIKRTKLRFPASLSPILSPLRQKLTPPRPEAVADDDGAGAVAREELDEAEYLADDGGGSNGAGHAVGARPRHGSTRLRRSSGSVELISLGIREPVYEVIEVKSDGTMSTKKISRRQLLKSSGLRPRDIRSVDPSLWLMNSMPSLLVREQAILLNLGTLRAIAMHECVLIFDYNRKGGKNFLKSLLSRLNPRNMNISCAMPFSLEVVEAALLSRIQGLEEKLMEVEPRVVALLQVLPNKLTADVLEQLRLSKQTLVELGSKAGALKQMLLDLLEDPDEIRHICIMGWKSTIKRETGDEECSILWDKQIAEEEEEEIEMLLENCLQRCESCHGQAERLLDSAKETEDSISVNLSSRRLEVSRVELLLQVGTFCVSVGALVAGIFGMNLKSYLEEKLCAFWLTTAGIIIGAVAAFFIVYSYLKSRRVL
ncbi:magnesium transporter MRS2-A, chloroplastic-like [Zingiber officinale]|uniref:magnesium transporter MRS2-A, chloroplastic-like n=1 Tax=Zingiber officinale TaxID=94328 RepID=UPI001C4D3D9E|nr:magnesium transporter MRS2-A, chloroplastic-like [Zingiber officinale]